MLSRIMFKTRNKGQKQISKKKQKNVISIKSNKVICLINSLAKKRPRKSFFLFDKH